MTLLGRPLVGSGPRLRVIGPTTASFSPERLHQIAALKDVLVASLNTTEPYVSGLTGDQSAFVTNYDWHSSVHAHWAALGIARATGDVKLERMVMSRLTPQALDRERVLLAQAPGFELPYGRAWLALMLSELAQHSGGDTPAARALRRQTEGDVLAWLERSPFPEGPSGRLSAQHSSWLFAYALLKMSRPTGEAASRLLRLQGRIDAARSAIAQHRSTPSDFLDLPAVLAVVDRAPPRSIQVAPYPQDRAGDLPSPPITHANAHSAGAAAVRLWPYAMDPNGTTVLDQGLAAMTARPDLYANAFDTVGHWVPQFMWMAMVLEAQQGQAIVSV